LKYNSVIQRLEKDKKKKIRRVKPIVGVKG